MKKLKRNKYVFLLIIVMLVITGTIFSCWTKANKKQDIGSFDIAYNSTLYAVEKKHATYTLFVNNIPEDADLSFSIIKKEADADIIIQSKTGAIILGKNLEKGEYPLEIKVISNNKDKYIGSKIIKTKIVVVNTKNASLLNSIRKYTENLASIKNIPD